MPCINFWRRYNNEIFLQVPRRIVPDFYVGIEGKKSVHLRQKFGLNFAKGLCHTKQSGRLVCQQFV